MIVIAQFEPDEEAGQDFSPTLPPPLTPDGQALPPAHDMTRLLFSLGMKGLHASVMDVESMACLSSWSVGDAGERSTSAEDANGASVPAAMATIVHLNATPFDRTLTRQIDPQSWAFAWRVDADHVAVAEARYSLPNSACTERDIAAVRQLCTAGIESGDRLRAEAMNDRFPSPASEAPVAAARPRLAVKLAPAGWAVKRMQRLRWPSLLAPGLAGAVCLAAALQIQSSRDGEAQRLRQLTDATMTQQLLRVLAAGDYGEVQASLETFEGLGYFKGAVVVDARHRAVARAGAVPALRIGHAVAGPEVAGARVVPLVAAASNTDGQLLLWGPETPSPRGGALLERALSVAGLLLVLATLAGAAILWRRRRRQRATGARQPLMPPPLSEAPR
jgi:hypothetical protein